jgi:hypothetical protein
MKPKSRRRSKGQEYEATAARFRTLLNAFDGIERDGFEAAQKNRGLNSLQPARASSHQRR